MEKSTQLRPLQRFFKLLELDHKEITYVYIYAIFSGLITLSLPLGVQAIIGLIAGGSVSASLLLLIFVVTAATALTGLLKVMQLTVTETVQRQIFTRSSFDFSYRIPRLRLDSLARYYPPELVNRFFDTMTLQKGVPKILMDFSSSLMQIIFGLILISFYHPFFVFFGVLLSLALILIFRWTGPSGLQTSLDESKYKYEVAYWLEEMARTMSTFKLAGKTQISMDRTDQLVCKYLDSRKKHFRILLFQYGNIVAFKTIVTASLLFLGSYLVINNQINIGQFVAAEIVVILVITSVEKLILTMETIYDVLTALEKLGHVTDMPVESEEGLDFDQIDNGGGIALNIEDLKFSYPDAIKPTIDGIKLRVAPGERLCISGSNRSGKSTLLQIINGFYSNYEGVVSYNGHPLASLKLSDLRAHTGYYSDDEDIFRGTIQENISLGHPELTLEEIREVSELVGLADYVQTLPQGYMTPLLPEGKNLPASVRMKVILARTLAARPHLLAVEADFYGMPAADRERIIRLLMEKNYPWTLLIVSNDPGIAARCDRVVVMDEGKIIGEGDYEDLLDNPITASIFHSYGLVHPTVKNNFKTA